MSKASNTHTASRRRLLASASAVLALPAAAVAAPTAQNPDAELIRACQQFAEAEFAAWYRYIVAPDDEADIQDTPPDWTSLQQITEMPAMTQEGQQAKALAYSAWNRDAFDDAEGERCPATSLVASLLRDLAAPARAAIIARLAKQYGPLPEGYTADGMWVGRLQA